MGVRFSVDWPPAKRIETPRLTLEPLRVEHADETFPVLDDHSLHEDTGGDPLTLEQLRARYARQVVGRSADGAQGWLNWIIRHRETPAVLGTVQATLLDAEGRMSAEIASIIALAYQRRGYAKQAASEMVGWLRQHGVDVFTAYVHPEHEALIGIAGHLGLKATDVIIDGETRWVSSCD